MWTLDSPVPEFSLRTFAGTVGPADIRGSWTILVQRTAPHVADLDACLDRFDVLADRVAECGCVLLVAIDTPGRALEERLASRPPGGDSRLLVGTWVGTGMPATDGMRFALIDPAGVLRAFHEFASEPSFVEWDVLARLDAVLGAVTPAGSRAPDWLGCVDWFDYESSGRARRPEPRVAPEETPCPR